MRISDWSSDVCSSDLISSGRAAQRRRAWNPQLGRTEIAMGAELDIDDVVAGHPRAESELKTLRDDLAMLRGALYDEQHGITATLRNDALDWYEYMAKQIDRKSTRLNSSH